MVKINKGSKRPRTIIACRRDVFYASVTRYNRQHPEQILNTSLIGTLHAATRVKVKEIGFRFIWVKQGRIYTRKD